MTEVRFITDDERGAFRRNVVRAFGGEDRSDPALDARFAATFDTRLCIGAFDGEQIVGTCSTFDLELQVPGGALPMAGTTVISVLPTHRRQGILTRMMGMHLDQAVDRGQPIAGLWATEHQIYRRFGYGPATDVRAVSFDATRITIAGPEPGVRVRMVEPDEAADIAPDVFRACTADRPGVFRRSPVWWEHRVLLDHAEFRGSMSERRWVIAEQDGEIVGYMNYRQKLEWVDEGANGKAEIGELVTRTPEARRALWHVASTIDLFQHVSYFNIQPDDPLPWLMDDPRQLSQHIGEGLWIRILDVEAALSARRYPADGSLVLGITDKKRPANSGNYQLRVTQGQGEVERVADTADVEMDIDVLGTLFLGYHQAGMLHAAARLTGSTDAVAMLDRLMGWPVPAWCQQIF